MKIEISNIRVAERLRKQVTKIEELAADIERNGLLNPITVMPAGEGYQLLAGLRRLRAAQLLCWTEIDVNVISPQDAEAALRVEFSENEQREPFTYSEKMDYARLIEAIVKAKALERKSAGGKGGLEEVDHGPPLEQGKSRDIIGPMIGMSGKQYARARYVADRASPEVIEQLDSGKKTISGVYRELRATDKAPPPASGPVKSPAPNPVPTPAPSPEPLLERAIRAERELDAMKYRQHNEIYHRDSIIDNLKMRNEALIAHIKTLDNRVTELEAALEEANARNRELEGK